jgi:hypothetical protein
MTILNTDFTPPSQIFWCCKALIEGRTISHEDEFREMNSWRLAASCYRLRHEFGWQIQTVYRADDWLAHYRLAVGTDVAKLHYPPSAAVLLEGFTTGDFQLSQHASRVRCPERFARVLAVLASIRNA